MTSTGLARATPDYDKLTTWDIGSVLAALYSARLLGLLPEREYVDRVRRTLATLERVPLFQGVFNKLYGARTGRMVGRSGQASARGYAWSATDLGRLLVWLGIVARSDSALAPSASRVARRIDYARVVVDGYLHGEEITPRGRMRRFQEGRIGYEQYAARGFALWRGDTLVANALDLMKHAAPVRVLDVDLLRDTRGLDRLTSDPFVLLGLELGWSANEKTLAESVLALQEQRFRRTGIVTVAGEDAMPMPPFYFYYYCVYCNGKAFVVDVADPGKTLDSPRWVSTKAAFGWHALLRSPYTAHAVSRVATARTANGWSSGVMERSGSPTRTYDLNTAAVILEAAAYHRVGRPLIQASAAAVTK